MAITPSKLCSDEYRAQLQQLIDDNKWAGSGERYAAEVWWLVTRFRAKSVIDYGCGPMKLHAALAGFPIEFRNYDPGIRSIAAMPTKPADIVVCTDVLEHIEPDRLHFVLQHIYDLTRLAAYVVVATRPADKRLPDGRNAHLIVDNARWWYDQLTKFGWKVFLHHYTIADPDYAHFVLRKTGSG